MTSNVATVHSSVVFGGGSFGFANCRALRPPAAYMYYCANPNTGAQWVRVLEENNYLAPPWSEAFPFYSGWCSNTTAGPDATLCAPPGAPEPGKSLHAPTQHATQPATLTQNLANARPNLTRTAEAARAAIGPARLLSHAPQAPYFGPIGESSWVGPSGGYTGVWKATKSIDFFNVQFYNQGDCYTTYASLFNSSAGGDASCPFPGTSVAELVAMGIDADAIIVGKPLLVDDADTGYVAGATLGQWFREAASTWKSGAFCWSWEKTAGPIWAADVF